MLDFDFQKKLAIISRLFVKFGLHYLSMATNLNMKNMEKANVFLNYSLRALQLQMLDLMCN